MMKYTIYDVIICNLSRAMEMCFIACCYYCVPCLDSVHNIHNHVFPPL